MAAPDLKSAAASPLYRDGSPADRLLSRTKELVDRAVEAHHLAEIRLRALASPEPETDKPQALKGGLPPFFESMHDHLEVLEDSVKRLESLLERTGL